ncbi:MAG: TfoX/Sxy family protein [Jatrophihabitans sp.]
MAYDDDLAERIRETLASQVDVAEKRMFGGLAFLLGGHIAVAAGSQGGLMLRVDPARSEELAERDGASRMVMRGREMTGWLRVAATALEDDDDLRDWVRHGVEFVRTLPPKRP